MADLSQFAEATAAVKHSPHAVSAWEEAEGLAADLDKPDAIVELFNDTLEDTLEPQVAEMIGERAGAFCDEWFGDDPKVLEKILSRVLVLAPTSESALQRLSVIFTVAERWADVLALYDRAITASKDKQARIRLLREASQLAKDVANQPEKAIAYYQKLLPLVPDDNRVSQSLERLLERHERWADLIALWEGRLEGQSKKEREKSRARITAVWLDNLADPRVRCRRSSRCSMKPRTTKSRPRCSSASSKRRKRPRAFAMPRWTSCDRTTTRRSARAR